MCDIRAVSAASSDEEPPVFGAVSGLGVQAAKESFNAASAQL
jgi:hypothetical protein